MLPVYFNFARDVVDKWARERPDSPALWCVRERAPREIRFSFRQLADQSRRAASFFNQIGIQRGDRVLVMAPRVPEWWTAMLGLIRLGAIPIPGTPMLTTKDIRYRLEAAGITSLVTDADGASKIEALLPLHEPGSSRRKEAHSKSGDRSQSLLTSAATVQGLQARTCSGKSLPNGRLLERSR